MCCSSSAKNESVSWKFAENKAHPAQKMATSLESLAEADFRETKKKKSLVVEQPGSFLPDGGEPGKVFPITSGGE